MKIYIILILLFSLNFLQGHENLQKNFIFNNKILFVENNGQYNPLVKFYSINQGFNIWVCSDYILLDYYEIVDNSRKGEVARINFNWNSEPVITTNDNKNAKLNYFLGKDKNSWSKNSKTFNSAIITDNASNRVELELDDNRFTCSINSDANIEDFYECFGKLKLEPGFNLVSYENDNIVSQDFTFQTHQPQIQTRESMIFSSFLGGSGWDSGQDIAVDKNGSIYVVGYTNSENFPTTIGAYSEELRASKHNEPDIFISKFDSTGSNLLFSTYIGSQMEDFGNGIAMDDSLNIYVTGYTGPTETFPITEQTFDSTQSGGFDAFLLKLNPQGDSLIYSTYIGSSNDDYGQSIAVDSKGNAHITGYTMYNLDFPVTDQPIQDLHNGKNDAFYCRMNSKGDALLVSTFLGGEDDDFGENILLGNNGLVYLVGSTRSTAFPVTTNAIDQSYNDTTTSTSRSDAFLSIIHNSGLYLTYSTYLGGSERDVAYSVGLDKDKSIYITGITESKDFPVTSYAYDTTYRSIEGERTAGDIFVTKLHSTGSNILYSTYIGGSSADKAYDIKISDDYYTYIIGSTSSFDMPVSKNAFDKTYNDSTFGADILIAALDASGHELVYSSYFGGSAHEISYSMQLLNGETIYFVGTTSSKDFPVTQTAFSSTYNNNNQSDACFSIITPKLLAVSAGGDKNGILPVCKGDLVQIGSNAIGSRGSVTYTWFPETGLSNPNIARPVLTVKGQSTYFVHVIDERGNEDWDTVHIELMPFIEAVIYGPQFVFKNSRHTYGTTKNDFAKYKWIAQGGTIVSVDTSYSISVKWGNGDLGYLTLVTTNDIGCSDTLKNFLVNIGDLFVPRIIPLGKTTFCQGDYCILDAGEGFEKYLWSDGKTSRFDTITTEGSYWVYLKDTLGFQAISDSIIIKVLPSPEKPKIIFNGKLLNCNIITGYYQWYHNGLRINGANQRTFEPLMIGTYKCEIGWNINSCTSFSDNLMLTFDSKVDDYLDDQIKIFPNPTENMIIIDFSNINYLIKFIKIYDLLGNCYFHQNTINSNNDKFEIDISSLQNGTYILNLYIKDRIISRKVIVFR